MIGLPDAFLEAGALPTLHAMYGLSVDKVVEELAKIAKPVTISVISVRSDGISPSGTVG